MEVITTMEMGISMESIIGATIILIATEEITRKGITIHLSTTIRISSSLLTQPLDQCLALKVK